MPKINWKILFIVIIAIGLRLVSINQSLWLDEAISVSAAQKSITDLFGNFLPKDFNPPLYYLILHFWLRIFSVNELFIRLPSVIFGVVNVYFVYRLYQLIFKDRKGALFSSLFLATSGLHIYYSQEARAYSLSAFLATGSIYFFFRSLAVAKIENLRRSLDTLDSPRVVGPRQAKAWPRLFTIHYSLFTILMLYSHYMTFLLLPAQWLYPIISKNYKKKKNFPNILISNILISLFLIPWVPTFLKQLYVGRGARLSIWSSVLGRPTFKNIVLLPVKFIIGRTSFDNNLLYSSIVLLLGLFFGSLLFFHFRRKETAPGAEYSRRKWKTGGEMEILPWLWLIVPAGLGMIISFKFPLFSYFRFLFILPAFWMLVARGCMGVKRKKIVIILVLAINLFFSFRYLLRPRFHRENWKKAVNVLHQQNQIDSKVMLFENVSAPFMFYDDNESDIVYIRNKELIGNEQEVWLIPYSQPIFDPNDKTRKYLENRGFIRVYEKHFNGVTLEKWQKPNV